MNQNRKISDQNSLSDIWFFRQTCRCVSEYQYYTEIFSWLSIQRSVYRTQITLKIIATFTKGDILSKISIKFTYKLYLNFKIFKNFYFSF